MYAITPQRKTIHAIQGYIHCIELPYCEGILRSLHISDLFDRLILIVHQEKNLYLERDHYVPIEYKFEYSNKDIIDNSNQIDLSFPLYMLPKCMIYINSPIENLTCIFMVQRLTERVSTFYFDHRDDIYMIEENTFIPLDREDLYYL